MTPSWLGPMHNEADLIHRCRNGDRHAQKQLFEQTSSRIYNLLLRMTGNPDDALELTQETYVRGLTRMADFDGRSSILTWLHRIAVNEALQLQRRNRMANGKHREIALTTADSHDGNGRISVRLDVEAALNGLPPEDRAILLLRYREECEYRTIGEILDLPPGTVASRLSRARDDLRKRLQSGYAAAEEKPAVEHLTKRKKALPRGDSLPALGELAE